MAKYFSQKELTCKCGKCGKYITDKEFLDMLDKAREISGIPFVITSPYRCLDYNRKIGSKDTSTHVKGLAVDISAKDSRSKFIIVDSLIKAGFSRIGIHKSFIHVDLDKSKSDKVMWLY